jgi:hypothetical protein
LETLKEKETLYYKNIISKALEEMERGNFTIAETILRGQVEKCSCGDFDTFDHTCSKS